MDLGGGFGVAYTSEHDPLAPKTLADALAEIVRRECRALGVEVPRVSVEPGRAIAGPSTFPLYRAGTIKDVELEHPDGVEQLSIDRIRPRLVELDPHATSSQILEARKDCRPAAVKPPEPREQLPGRAVAG